MLVIGPDIWAQAITLRARSKAAIRSASALFSTVVDMRIIEFISPQDFYDSGNTVAGRQETVRSFMTNGGKKKNERLRYSRQELFSFVIYYNILSGNAKPVAKNFSFNIFL
jgi:hypothetical protein